MKTAKNTRTPLVSIICVTYNHEKYLAQTLDSFLAQEVSFPLEIIVHDDASTDGTRAIIEEYARKHPSIRPMYEEVNQYSLGNDDFVNRMYAAAQGKYMALCEGDDFWTDPQKLQVQVDFLEKHPDYALCFHPVRMFFDDGSQPDVIYPESHNADDFTAANLLRRNFIQSNSVMYRRRPDLHIPAGIIPMDWYTHLYHAKFGKIGFIDRTMAAYRRHPGGIWWQSDKDLSAIWRRFGVGHIRMYTELAKLYGQEKDAREVIGDNICTVFYGLSQIDANNDEGLVRKAMDAVPDGAELFVQTQSQAVVALKETVKSQQAKLDKLHNELHDERRDAGVLKEELRLIKSSRVWKLRTKAAKAIGKK
jgi:glycosyltransferase involved in cell wall biosynthesis